jgi:hypothetical protein
MKSTSMTVIAALALAAGGAAAQQGTPDKQQAQPGRQAAPADSQSMEKLKQSAQRLRESIQTMAQKKPGPDRDRAIAEAHEALLETQRAMVALPPELRGTATVRTADYDKSVRKLMKAADSLRESIQAMAQQPPGERRNRAIDQARQALWDTQSAMLSAYAPGSAGAQTMGAAGQSTAGNAQANAGAGGKAQAAARTAGSAEGAVLMLVPVRIATDATLADGCWVRFYDGSNFTGATLTLAGPVEMPRMYPAGNVWRDWESAVVGPNAQVTTFDEENFRDRTAKLGPGQRVPDLRERKLGWFDEVHSARVTCS